MTSNFAFYQISITITDESVDGRPPPPLHSFDNTTVKSIFGSVCNLCLWKYTFCIMCMGFYIYLTYRDITYMENVTLNQWNKKRNTNKRNTIKLYFIILFFIFLMVHILNCIIIKTYMYVIM